MVICVIVLYADGTPPLRESLYQHEMIQQWLDHQKPHCLLLDNKNPKLVALPVVAIVINIILFLSPGSVEFPVVAPMMPRVHHKEDAILVGPSQMCRCITKILCISCCCDCDKINMVCVTWSKSPP